MPFGGWTGDINVLICDWNSDGRNDLIMGAGVGGGPVVQIVSVNGGGGFTIEGHRFVAQCDASYCYTGGVTPIGCGSRYVTVRFGNGVVQGHYF